MWRGPGAKPTTVDCSSARVAGVRTPSVRQARLARVLDRIIAFLGGFREEGGVGRKEGEQRDGGRGLKGTNAYLYPLPVAFLPSLDFC